MCMMDGRSVQDSSRAKIRDFERSHNAGILAFFKKRILGQKTGEFIFLDRNRHDVDENLTILGCTLHSRLDPEHEAYIGQWLNDFKRVRGWTTKDYLDAHANDLAWLNEQVTTLAKNEPGRRVMVFSHHAPTIEDTSAPQYVGSKSSSGFATELTSEPCWTSGNVVLWAFGHTHFPCEFVREGVKVYSNARGNKYEASTRENPFNVGRYVNYDPATCLVHVLR